MSRAGARQLARLALLTLAATLTSHRHSARASEFPERECCDPIYPIPEPTSRAPSAPTPTGRSGANIKTPVAILNCLYARQLCFEDASCSAILQIIPRVCGPELVACSTVTVTKCQAALHTLQAFSFFRPTCLCKEPHVDPECNSFQNFLFDHPCVYVLKKDKDPYPNDALLTCNHANNLCQHDKPCNKLFDDFKASCRVREGKCRMENRDACHDAWTQLRLSPMFGCICPNNQSKKRCEKISFNVNHNPCVDFLPSSASVDLSGTDSALYPFDPQQENFQEIWLPPTSMYPYFLFPDATSRGRTSYYDNNEGDEIEERRGDVARVENRNRRPSDEDESRHSEQVPELPGGSRTGRPRITVYGGQPYGGYAERDGDPDAERAEPGGFDRSRPDGTIYDRGDNRKGAVYDDEQRRSNEQLGINLGHESYSIASSSSYYYYYDYHYSSSSSLSNSQNEKSPSYPFPDQAKHDHASSTEHQHPRQSSHDLEQHPNHHQHQNVPYNRHRDRHRQHQTEDRESDDRYDDYYHVPDGKQPYAPYPALAPAPSRSSAPNTNVRDPDHARPAPPPSPPYWHQGGGNVHGTKAHAPSRPTYYYEHGVLVGRFDDRDDRFDSDGSSRSGLSYPLDRLLDLREAFEGFIDQVKIISHPDNSTSFEVIESQLENPLIDADHQDLHALKQLPLPGIHHRPYHRKNQTGEENDDSGTVQGSDVDRTIPHQPVKLILSSTCHHAYTLCKNDTECKGLLQPVLNHCDNSSCARNECMNALQHFYKKANHRHSMEIAFCLCKKTEDQRDECIVAQEKMHPACAQRVELAEMPTCHSLAEVCREDKSCRYKLEHYEQSCAVDSVTKKCAGPPSDCRKAMLGILGTELRSNCACKGTDFTQLYDCLGWQRLLWVNPCVVESQKDYHARKKHHRYVHQQPKTTTATPVIASPSTTATTYFVTTLEVIEPAEDNVIPEVTRSPTTQPATTAETTTITPSTTPSTTTTTTTPPRFCVVQRPRQTHQYIREGKGKRLYRDDEPECSELCQCGEGEVLVCNTICIESSPCKTPFAFYNHAAPAYQAFRGRCLCYSGQFICMRPSPEAYSIPHGVFMFLGYSEMDETLLRPHNNLTVLDAFNSLDSFMREEANNQTVCTLFLYNVTRENVIAVARLGGDNPPLNSSQSQSLQHLLRVKEQCSGMLQDLSEKINNKHQEVHTHPLLSIFKMAEVEVNLPQGGVASDATRSSWLLVLLGSMASLITRSRILLSGASLDIRGSRSSSIS